MRLTHCTSLLLTAAIAASLLSACGGGTKDPVVLPSSLKEVSQAPAGMVQTANPAVDTFVQAKMKEGEIPGLSLAVLENGKLLYARTYGYANLASGTPATPDHKFQIGSISKSFTGVAVMLLVEEGKIKLDEPISTYIGPVPAAWAPITVRHLLNHTAGLREDPDDAGMRHLLDRFPDTDAQFLDLVKTIPLIGKPGEAFSYSNIGFNVLTFIITKASGKGYQQFFQERIFTPLKMNATRIMHRDDAIADMATGYIKTGAGIEPDTFKKEHSRHLLHRAASGIESTALDMAKFEAALHDGVLPSLASRTEMWANSALVQAASVAGDASMYYGLGWFLSTVDGYRKVYHSGGMPAYSSDFIRYPREGISVIVLTNQGYNRKEHQLISRKVAQLFRPGLPYCCDPK
jgi:CubicO group peptidase (beta-lactamase class C family)